MKTLWSGMNKVSGAARSIGKAHRQETLDDTWEIQIGRKLSELICFLFLKVVFNYHFFLVSTPLTKQKRSQIGLDFTEPVFNQLTKSCLQQNLSVKA